MKEFNLEAALKGAKVVTRDGQEVTEIHHFETLQGADYPILVAVQNKIISVSLTGIYDDISGENELDLFMAPEKLQGFIIVYPKCSSEIFNTIAEARHARGTKALAIIDLSTIEEGHNL